MLLAIIAAVPVIIWIYLLAFRGRFWEVNRSVTNLERPNVSTARLAVVIPARNEAAVIGRALSSLFEQDFPAPLHIFLIDDASTDRTAEIAAAAAERAGKTNFLTIISGQPLPRGWTGKLWALSQGVARAEALEPDYILLTDADIVHGPHTVAQLVAIAEALDCDLASYMVKLACVSTAEKALIPAFVFFFVMLYPPAWISPSRHRTAAAAGGCILIRPACLEKIGGLAAIRGEVIDDCALAREVKRSGGRIWMGLSSASESIRSYDTFSEIGQMISRTAFNQLDHSSLLLAGTVIGLALTYVLPPLLLLTGNGIATILGLTAWMLMSFAYFPMVRFYKQRPLWAIALPLIACFYAGATVHSAIRYWRGRGGAWKGRVQDTRP